MFAADLTVSAAEANRSFSKLLRAAKAGRWVTITSHGRPVAELGPVGGDAAEVRALQRREANRRLVAHLKAQGPVGIGPWTRDQLYDRD